MKHFEEPMIDIIEIDIPDVITASPEVEENETGRA